VSSILNLDYPTSRGLIIWSIFENPCPNFAILSWGSLNGNLFQVWCSWICGDIFLISFSQEAQDHPPRGFFAKMALSPSVCYDSLAYIKENKFSICLSIWALIFFKYSLSTNFLVLLLIWSSKTSRILSKKIKLLIYFLWFQCLFYQFYLLTSIQHLSEV
jgi:hypothetical protein